MPLIIPFTPLAFVESGNCIREAKCVHVVRNHVSDFKVTFLPCKCVNVAAAELPHLLCLGLITRQASWSTHRWRDCCTYESGSALWMHFRYLEVDWFLRINRFCAGRINKQFLHFPPGPATLHVNACTSFWFKHSPVFFKMALLGCCKL